MTDNARKRILLLMAIMAAVVVAVLASSLMMLYQVTIEQQRQRLSETVTTQAQLIHSVARFDAQHSQDDVAGGAQAATLKQVFDAFEKLPTESNSFEFVLAKKQGDQIAFIATRRAYGLDPSFTVPINSTLAEPMRRALEGQAGTIIAEDYEGIKVLAAYEPVDTLSMGIVAKLDMSEIRQPFIHAIYIAILVALVYIGLGTWLFHRIGSPLVRKLSESELRYRDLSEQLQMANQGLEEQVAERTRNLEAEHEKLRNSLHLNESLMDVAADCIITTDGHGIIETFNKSAESVFGYAAEAILGKKINMLMPPAVASQHDGYMENHVNTGGMFAMANSLKVSAMRENGEIFPIEINVREVRVSDTRRFIAIIRDLTALEHAQHALEKEHQFNERLVRAIPSILISTDVNRVITLWNSAAEKVFGIDSSMAIGRHVVESGVKCDWRQVAKSVLECRKKGFSRLNHFKFERVDGSDGFLGLTFNPIVEDGKVAGYLLLGSDITERINLENRLQLAQKMEAVGELAAGIAHEINTPLQYVGDNIRFLKSSFHDMQELYGHYYKLKQHCEDEKFAPEMIEVLNRADADADIEFIMEEIPSSISQSLDGIEKAARIVGAMKEFSHPGQKEKGLADINRMLESTITVARNEWKYVADMKTDFDETLPLVKCLPELNQVFLNLIINAAHAIEAKPRENGSETGLITIATSQYNQEIWIEVTDTGVGIPQALQQKVFEPFFTTKEVGKGSGQGLAISHSIVVEQHKGSLDIVSEEGMGTTFIIRIPVEQEKQE